MPIVSRGPIPIQAPVGVRPEFDSSKADTFTGDMINLGGTTAVEAVKGNVFAEAQSDFTEFEQETLDRVMKEVNIHIHS